MPRVLGGPRGVRIFYERGTHVRILQKSFRSLKLQRTSSTFGRSPTIDGQWNKSCWKVLFFFQASTLSMQYEFRRTRLKGMINLVCEGILRVL